VGKKRRRGVAAPAGILRCVVNDGVIRSRIRPSLEGRSATRLTKHQPAPEGFAKMHGRILRSGLREDNEETRMTGRALMS